MTFKWFRLLPIAAMSFFPALSQAQSLCDPGGLQQEMELREQLPKACQKERLQASGRVSFNIINSAEKIANEAWRREAVTKYGERYADTKYMACRQVLCVRGSIAGTHRCTISGFPCAADMSDVDKGIIKRVETSASLESPYGQGGEGSAEVQSAYGGYHPRAQESELDEEAIKRLQELLGVPADGDFGPTSYRALRDFRRSAGIPLEGPPTPRDLERLAHSERRRYGQ
jgi:peptidoglycan hydrolase-like protein with peptidoglycan-binding domain